MSRAYVRNKDLLVELDIYKETGVIPEALGEMILAIATNYASKGNFAGYTWKEDMIGEAALTCVKFIKNFNREKSNNPFAYITQICKNAFISYIKKQQKHSQIKETCYECQDRINGETFFYSYRGIDYEKLKS